MKIKLYKLFALLFVLIGCDIEDQVNPNNKSLNSILAGASNTDLGNLVTGALANLREQHDLYVTSSGTLARELYLFDADPRNRTDLVGVGTDILDNSSFYTTRPWTERYKTINNLNILLRSLANAEDFVSAARKNGYSAFANTMLAHQFLTLINYFNNNGIRLDVADQNNLGPIVTDTDVVFTEIMTLLNDAQGQLANAEFSFELTPGFSGFDTPAEFLQFNRALAAKVELFRGNYAASLTLLSSSFLDLTGDLSVGPKMDFSTAGGDLLNGLFKAPGQSGDQIVVNNSFINDADPGDLRVANKTALRTNPVSSSGFNGTHETRLFADPSSPVDIIRNEELVLIYAEANIGLNTAAGFADAVTALDVIRASAGLAPYSGTVDQPSLIDEMLRQRRYSLWGEGHRMIDLRRYDRMNTTYVTLDVLEDSDADADQQIFSEFPVPATEF